MKLNKLLLALAASGIATSAFATNGMFSHGYGTKVKSMGGAGVATAIDGMSAATNPASMVAVGNSMELGLDLFRPDRHTSITGNGGGGNFSMDANEDSLFPIPEFAYNKMLGANRSVGVVVYGNGGMNTSYPSPIVLFGSSKAGIDLAQLFVAPTMAWKLNDSHSAGVSLNLAYQRFKATGLEHFNNANQSSSVGNVTNRGYDDAFGFGVKVGWQGQINPNVTLGASYQTKTDMSKFDKYKGLFAEQGNIDVPSTWALGLAVKASPKTLVAFDVQRINYSDSKAISNPLGPAPGGVLTNKLGADNGAGFGWKDMTAYKLGVEHQYNDKVTLRAGWNHGSQPIPADQTFFNLLAPGVIEDHLTLGVSWKAANGGEWSATYMHGFSKNVNGSGSIPAGFGSGEANLKMSQDALGIAYSWKM